MDEYIKKMYIYVHTHTHTHTHTHNGILFSYKKKEILAFATIWIALNRLR